MMIRPASDATAYAAGGPLAATAANFPCCKLFFPFSETSGRDFLDVIQGSTYSAPGAVTPTFSGGGVTFPAGSYTNQDLAVPIPVATKNALLFVVGNITSGVSAISIAGASTGLMTINTASGSVVSDTTNVATLAAATGNALVGNGTKLTPGTANEGQRITCSLATYTADAAVSAVVGDLTTMPTITKLAFANPASPMILYALAFFVFDTVPSALLINAAVSEMTANWQNNRKWLPSVFKGLA